MEIIEENQDGINIYKLNGHLDFNTSFSSVRLKLI
jgi:hypothetical protein